MPITRMSKLSQHRVGNLSPPPPPDLSSIQLGSKENTTSLSADQGPVASGQGQQVDQRRNSKGKPVFVVTALSMDMCPGLARKHRVATTSAPGQHPAHTHTHTARTRSEGKLPTLCRYYLEGMSPWEKSQGKFSAKSSHLSQPLAAGSSPFGCSSSYKNSSAFPAACRSLSLCCCTRHRGRLTGHPRHHEEPAPSGHSGCTGCGSSVLW